MQLLYIIYAKNAFDFFHIPERKFSNAQNNRLLPSFYMNSSYALTRSLG